MPPRRPKNSSGSLGRCHPAEDAVTGHDLDRADPVDGQAVGAGHRSEATSGGVADDAHVGDRPGQRCQAVGGRGLHDADPLHAGADARPALGMDDALVESLGVDEDRADELGDRAVPGGLRRHEQAVPGGEAHRLDHVLRGARGQDGGRAHRDGQVPGRDEGVVLLAALDGDGAGRGRVELGKGVVGVDQVRAGSRRESWCPPGLVGVDAPR